MQPSDSPPILLPLPHDVYNLLLRNTLISCFTFESAETEDGRALFGARSKGFTNWNKCEMFPFPLLRNAWPAAQGGVINFCLLFWTALVDVECKIKVKEMPVMGTFR